MAKQLYHGTALICKAKDEWSAEAWLVSAETLDEARKHVAGDAHRKYPDAAVKLRIEPVFLTTLLGDERVAQARADAPVTD